MTKKSVISTIRVVFFNDLEHADLEMEGFNKISYGDAEHTLVYADDLARELEDRDDPKLLPLINELESIPDDVLVALDG